MDQVNSSLWLSIKDRRVQEKEVRDWEGWKAEFSIEPGKHILGK